MNRINLDFLAQDRIFELEQHPTLYVKNNKNAIELQNTTVHVNGNKPLQIVCYETSKREDIVFIQKNKK